MANRIKEEQKKEDHAAEVVNNDRLPPPTPAKKKCNSLNLLAAFFAIVAIAIAAYSVYSTTLLQNKLKDEDSNLRAEIEQLKTQQASSQQQVDTKATTIEQGQSDLQSKLSHLDQKLQVAMSQRLYQNQDWLMLKARYYLELAQINAHWSDNYSAAVSLLQEADKLLEQLHVPQVFEIRQAIAKEIALLKAIPTIDIAGLLSRLDAAQSSVSKLTIQSTMAENEEPLKTDARNTSKPSAWKSHLQDSLSLLKKLVVIRRDDEDVKPLISPFQESIIKESIRLNLQEAQWAILNNNPAVYNLALKQAIVNLTKAFNENAQDTKELLKQLNELQQIKITQERPLIELALPLLNQMINSKEAVVNPVNDGSKGDNK